VLVALVGLGAALWIIAEWPVARPRVDGRVPTSSAEVAACIRDPSCRRVFVVAHRAEGFGGPENSRAAVASAVAAGVPVIEIDLRGSKDGRLFVLHDGTLARYTRDLGGRVDETASEDIARARLANGETIPRFEDIYAITRGRALLSVDFKVSEHAMAGAADWLAVHGSFDDVIFFANTGEEIAIAARMKQRYPRAIVMVRLLDTRVTVDSTRAAFAGRLPDIFHTNRVGADEVTRLHALGVKVYMNAVPLERHLPPFRSFVIRSLLRTGVDFVLSGDPGAMMRRVETVGR
jgi:glycerophosphoryl diester phosphodiesterase